MQIGSSVVSSTQQTNLTTPAASKAPGPESAESPAEEATETAAQERREAGPTPANSSHNGGINIQA